MSTPASGFDRACPVCEASQRNALYTSVTGQHICECRTCGMVFAYGGEYVNYATHSIYVSKDVYGGEAHKKHHLQILSRIYDHNTVYDDADILDVGCATGEMLAVLRDEGFFNSEGISLSQREVDCCIGRGFKARLWDTPHKQFDLAIVSHVLEHVVDVPKFLNDLKPYIKDTGRVYVEVPNALGYSKYFQTLTQGFNAEHINHFSPRLLAECLERQGFSYELGGAALAELNSTGPYPLAWGVFTKAPSLCRAIETYIISLENSVEQVQNILEKSLPFGKIALWGLGQTTDIIEKMGFLQGRTIVAATDTNSFFHGKERFGVKVVAPEYFKPDEDVPILVAAQISKSEIAQRIRELGLSNKLVLL